MFNNCWLNVSAIFNLISSMTGFLKTKMFIFKKNESVINLSDSYPIKGNRF